MPMMQKTTLAALMGITLLAACGGSSGGSTPEMDEPTLPFAGNGAARNADGSATVRNGSTLITLPAGAATVNGQPAWIGNGLFASGFETPDVFAVGGVQNGVAFSGIFGRLAPIPVSNLEFTGRYAVNTATGSVSDLLTITYNATTDRITGSDADFALNGTVSSTGAASGSVVYDGDTAPFIGGLYGTTETDVAGSFNTDTFGGVFYGTNGVVPN